MEKWSLVIYTITSCVMLSSGNYHGHLSHKTVLYFLGLHTSLYMQVSVYTKNLRMTSWIYHGIPEQRTLHNYYITP